MLGFGGSLSTAPGAAAPLATLACRLFLSRALLCAAEPAFARVEATLDYTKTQTYSGALRYLRVELEYEVTERDPDAAYLIFRYRPPARKDTVTGTVEIVDAEGRVRLFLRIPQMPTYHEQVLRDGLLRKLREEYGEPVRQKPKPKPDAGESKPSDPEKPRIKPSPKPNT